MRGSAKLGRGCREPLLVPPLLELLLLRLELLQCLGLERGLRHLLRLLLLRLRRWPRQLLLVAVQEGAGAGTEDWPLVLEWWGTGKEWGWT